MGFARASGWAKVALLCVFIGAILDIVGFATPNWFVYASGDGTSKVNVGLWTLTACSGTSCTTAAVTDAYANTLFNIMRIMETIGVILSVFLVFFLLIYVCVDSMKTQRVARTAMGMCFLTGILLFIGMCLCLAYVPYPYVVGYSMGLTVLAFLLILIAGSLLIPDSCEPKDDDFDFDDDYPRSARPRRSRWD